MDTMNPTANSKESRAAPAQPRNQEKPAKNTAKTPNAEAQAPSVSAEATAASEKASSAAQSPQFVVPPLAIPASPPMPAPQTATAAASPPATDLNVVDDGDLIEKEWVNKAKEIVAKTHDDPYVQSEELTIFKADYMKKRYDKHIKLSK